MPGITGKATRQTLRRSLLLVLGLCLFLLAARPAEAGQSVLDKIQLSALTGPYLARLIKNYRLRLTSARLGPLTLETTLDPAMQAQARRILKRQRSRRAALVVVEAKSGRVLVLAGMRRRRFDPRVALDHRSPAASLFKMVTAAAALEESSITPASRLRFVGRPHTLYRYQVRRHLRRKPRYVTLTESFAKSNNPVFARLGIHRLGGDLLTWYGRALGFERPIPFELPLGTSRMFNPRTDFQVGELASGFTRTTTISPLHAALLVSIFVNGGRFVEPYVIKQVVGAGGEVLYQGRRHASGRLVSRRTCRYMRRLFGATIKKGTARRAFRRLYRDRVLRGLELGGKTGTLRGPDRRELFEWFAGYGRDPRTGKTLAICSLVVHGKRRRGNSKKMARLMLHQAFRILRHRPTRLVAVPARNL